MLIEPVPPALLLCFLLPPKKATTTKLTGTNVCDVLLTACIVYI